MKVELFNDFYLSPIQWSDLENLVHYVNAPDISKNTSTIPYPYTEANGKFFLDKVVQVENIDLSKAVFAIRKEGLGMIGAIGLHHHAQFGAHRREIGYWLGTAFRGQNIVSTAAQALSDWALANTEVRRIEAYVFDFNPASKRVLEKAGFEFEGRLRRFHEKNGSLIDAVMLAKIIHG